MTKNDYIEKITQNLEHLTKDELKDVATLTNAQFEVRLKVAEKEYWGKEIANLKSQLQQQALPVVPEFVAEFIEDYKKEGECLFGIFADATRVEHDMPDLVYFWLGDEGNNDELFARAWLNGYQVEKPQLFRVCLLDGRHTLTRRDPRKTLPFNYTFLWSYSSELKEMREINREVDLFTEQEIKSIDERYWQFAVPVEDGE